MDVWWTEVRVVHGADADKPDRRAGLRVVAPNGNSAGRASSDLLAFTARGRRDDDLRLTGGVHDTVGFIERVECVPSPGLAPAPAAMAGMNDQWCSGHRYRDSTARASVFPVRLRITNDLWHAQ